MGEPYRRRRLVDRLARGACAAATVVAVLPLLAVLLFVVARGVEGLSLDFFTGLPAPVGEPGGGMGNAIVGSLVLVALACAFSIPIGVMAGIYLAEYGNGALGRVVRFAADVLAGIPSIIAGIFAYTLVVLPMGHFSALAGGTALGVLMIPTVTRSAEELLKLVPDSLREAALALGVPRWKATLRVVLRTAAPGIVTGLMLAVARAAGETAPLLFTAFGNRHWSASLTEPMASLPVQIYTYAVSPFAEWHRQAWGAALVLLTLVLLLNLSARALARHRTIGP